ncbi:hypothetical protein J6590_004788 [Homalodisca vitripennis]|nr:hypothetical protein J6590_004788 [Homalodisca vitripennis]
MFHSEQLRRELSNGEFKQYCSQIEEGCLASLVPGAWRSPHIYRIKLHITDLYKSDTIFFSLQHSALMESVGRAVACCDVSPPTFCYNENPKHWSVANSLNVRDRYNEPFSLVAP